MPTYDFRCKSCKHEFEEFQSMSAKPLKKCPACGKPALERLIGTGAAIVFKGSGFYQTDYRSESYKKAAEADSGSSKPADTSDASKSETAKTDAAKPDSAKSDTAKSDAAKSEPSKSDTSNSGAQRPAQTKFNHSKPPPSNTAAASTPNSKSDSRPARGTTDKTAKKSGRAKN
jgi:putative FmdB family regulatory protein